MQIENSFPLLDSILDKWQQIIGSEFVAYKNHCQRMINFCFILHQCSEEDKKKIIIASAFHDIGIWTNNTVDYIPPSIPPAIEYLNKNGLESWSEEISLMISEHHKLRLYNDKPFPLVEVFRKGDLVDFSLGMVSFGIDKNVIKQVKNQFPNSGFHKFLLKIASKWFLRHPLNPAPMMKW